MSDHTLNLLLAERRVRRAELDAAKREQRHDDITPLARELRAVENRISERLNGRST